MDRTSSPDLDPIDEVDAATRAIGMARGMNGTDKCVSAAVLDLYQRNGPAAFAPSRIAYGLQISESRVIASLQRLIATGLVHSIFVPDLPAMTALWDPAVMDKWQDDGEES